MKKLYSLPDDRTILDCLANDILDRNADVVRFCTILDSCHECTVISLDGAWGSGKTFFVKQVKMLLDGFCENSKLEKGLYDRLARIRSADDSKYKNLSFKQKHTTVYYDAWENDNDTDPILSIIYATLKSKQVDQTIHNEKNLGEILSSIAECVTGRSITTLFESIKGKDPIAEIKKSESIEISMKQFLNAAIGNQTDRLIIFIDELDRCKPTFAIALLERIKHYFTDARLTFVFSINQNQLQHTVKSYYGYGMDASKYLEKSFDISIPLPPANYDSFLQHVGFEDSGYTFNKVSYSVIRYFDFGLREITKYIQYLNSTISDVGNNKRKIYALDEISDRFCLYYIAPILIGLRLHSISEYTLFIKGKFPVPFVDILSQAEKRHNISGYILRWNESFLENPDGTDGSNKESFPVNIRDRLLEIYYAFFKYNYESSLEINMGDLTIDKYSRSRLLDFINPIW